MSDTMDPAAPFAAYGETETAQRSRFQKIVARTLTANASNIPHVTHHDDIDVTGLEAHRQAQTEGKASPLIYLIKAVVDALKDFPQFNASLSADGEILVLKKYFHIGIAVDGPLGLLVPVLSDCDRKDIPALAAELKEVSRLARAKGRRWTGCRAVASPSRHWAESAAPISRRSSTRLSRDSGGHRHPHATDVDRHSLRAAEDFAPLAQLRSSRHQWCRRRALRATDR